MNEHTGLRAPSQPAGPQGRPAQATVSLIDRDSHFTGSYRTPHDMRIEGRYEGDIECQGTVFVGETASVNARIIAGNVIVAGQFEGEIACDTRFEILQTGRVSASVSASVTVVHEGAFYQGELRMVRASATTDRQPAPPTQEPQAVRPAASEPSARSARPAGAAAETPAQAAPPQRRPAEAGTDEPERPSGLLATTGAPRAGNGRAPQTAEGV